MIKKIEHIGLAVKNLNDANRLFSKLLNKTSYKEETILNQKVVTSFYKVGETKIELIEPFENTGPIEKYINKKGEGVHHLAFHVDDIDAEVERLKKEGFIFVDEEKKRGADNKWVCFLHPKSTNNILIELCQDIK